jgi:MATE family multidrug resistance protein
MTYMVYLGVSIAAAVRIGNHLGAGRGRAARRATALAFALVLAPAALVASGLLVGRRAIASLFTTDADIRAAVARATLALGAYQLLDAANCAAGGVLRASGRQLVGAVSGLVAFYVVGLPLGYVLGFRAGLWVSGLWWAMVAGLACACATNGGTVALTDWGAQVEAARARLAAEEGRAEADGKGDEDEDEDEEARAPALTPLEPAA